MTAKEYYKNLKEGDRMFHFQRQEWGIVTKINENKIKWQPDKGLCIYVNTWGNNPILLYQETRVLDLDNLPPRPEKKRWRANVDQIYYCFNNYFGVYHAIEEHTLFDNEYYDKGIYFRTKELAEQAAEQIKELLTKFHEENE